MPAEEKTPSSYSRDLGSPTPSKLQHPVIGNMERLIVPARAAAAMEAKHWSMFYNTPLSITTL